MQENLHRRKREKISGPLPRTPTRRRKKEHNTSKPVARYFNLRNHSNHNMTICGLSSHHGTQKKAAKIANSKSFFNCVHSLHTELMNAYHFTNLFINSCVHIFTIGKAPLQLSKSFTVVIQPLSACLIKPKSG